MNWIFKWINFAYENLKLYKMKTPEKILREYVHFKDVNSTKTVKLLPLTIIDAMEQYCEQLFIYTYRWIVFDFSNIETHPPEYGKYLICRKDGKIHWETWNNSGWAYNHNEIIYYAKIFNPVLNK